MIDLYVLCMDLKNSQSAFSLKSRKTIFDIYSIVCNPSTETNTILDCWKEAFKYVYGDIEANLSSNNKLNTNDILQKYNICPKKGNEAKQTQLLFYSIQTYYSVLIKLLMKEILSSDDYEYSNKETSISAHVLDKLYIPEFNKYNDIHKKIAEICKKGHAVDDPSIFTEELDKLVLQIYLGS